EGDRGGTRVGDGGHLQGRWRGPHRPDRRDRARRRSRAADLRGAAAIAAGVAAEAVRNRLQPRQHRTGRRGVAGDVAALGAPPHGRTVRAGRRIGGTGPEGPGRGLTATDRVARAVFALLVAACFAAFFVTQRLKHTPTAVQMFKLTPFFSPSPSG